MNSGRPSPNAEANGLDALYKAAAAFGGLAQLAKELGVTPQAVNGWRLRGYVPAERVLEIERLTGVSRHTLRPDLYPVNT